MNQPDYKKIYSDLIAKKFPEKAFECRGLLRKNVWSELDIIALNEKIFQSSSKEYEISNKKHRSYKEPAIKDILDYQRKNGLNNSQLAKHFKISRNSVAKWKKLEYLDNK